MTYIFKFFYSPRKVAKEAVFYLDSKKKTATEIREERDRNKVGSSLF